MRGSLIETPKSQTESAEIRSIHEYEPQYTNDSESPLDTDDEGYAEVKGIKDLRTINGRRQFLVQFKKQDKGDWLHERDSGGCVSLLKEFCATNNIT